MQEALTAYLLADASLSALVLGRIHWGRLPASVVGRPYINLTLVSEPANYCQDGRVNFNEARVQVDAWAETAANAKAVRDAVLGVVDGKVFALQGVKFQGVFVDGGRDLLTETVGAERPLFGKTTDLKVLWSSEA